MAEHRPTAGTAGAPRRSLKGWLVAMAIGVPVFLGGTALLTVIITTAIWPGEVERFAPILCEAPRTEAFVVSDTYSSDDGTSTDFTLYCVSADGEAEDVGWARPWYLAWALHTVLLLAVLTAFRIRWELRRWRADRSGGGSADSDGDPRPAKGRSRAPKRPAGPEPATLGELIDRDFPPA